MGIRKKTIYFSRFVPDAGSDGGSRRSAQLFQAFSFLNPELISLLHTSHVKVNPSLFQKVAYKLRNSRFKTLNDIEKRIISENEYHLWHADHRGYVYGLKRVSGRWAAPSLTTC